MLRAGAIAISVWCALNMAVASAVTALTLAALGMRTMPGRAQRVPDGASR